MNNITCCEKCEKQHAPAYLALGRGDCLCSCHFPQIDTISPPPTKWSDTQIDNEWEAEMEEAAKKLSECNDVMPESLSEHQSKVLNACLDMIYIFRSQIDKAENRGYRKGISEHINYALCAEKLVTEAKSELLSEIIEKAEGMKKSYEGMNREIPNKKSYNQALTDIISYLKDKKQ